MHSLRSLVAYVLLVTYCSIVHGFYVPGVAPRDYSNGEPVEIKVLCAYCAGYTCCVLPK